MTTDTTTLVAVPRSNYTSQLASDVVSSAARAAKAGPGDRAEIARYERLCTQLETLAWQAARAGAPTEVLLDPLSGAFLPLASGELTDPLGAGLLSILVAPADGVVRNWLADGLLVVAVTHAFQPGRRISTTVAVESLGVARTWRAPEGLTGARAVEARFRAQLKEAVTSQADGETRAAITPSGIHNRILTTVLREYVAGSAISRVDAPIAYRDGSRPANLFPLRCLPLRPSDATAEVVLDLVLLSIRHTDMDLLVDGAWLRNAEVSRPRPAAQTDDFVFETSLAQLDSLTDGGHTRAELRIYQTGLDAAVIGFYRSVVVHLTRHPGTLTVIPMFASPPRPGASDTTRFRAGEAWSTEGPS